MKKYLRLLPSIIVITTLATTAFSAQAATVAYYNMDELSGDIADSSGNNLDAGFRSVGTGFAYNQPSVPVGTYGALTVDASTAAFFGGSFKGGDDTINRRNFDAGAPAAFGDLITAGPGSSDGIGTLTIMAWINLDRVTGNQRIFGTGSAGNGGWAFGTGNGTATTANLNFTTYGGADNNVAAGLEAGTWYHIAATYDNNSLEFFVNGNSVGTDANAGNFTEENPSGANYRIGSSRDGADQFYGFYDEVKIFDTVLTVEQIRAAAIPEPSTLITGGLGLLAMLFRRR